MKFQKISMTGCRNVDKKHQKYPKNGFFPPFVTPQDFFSKIGLYSLLYPYGALFMQKIRKNQCTVSEIIKDGRTTDGLTDKGYY